MSTAMILQFRTRQLDLQDSVRVYEAMLAVQGFPPSHRQLLRELKTWLQGTSRLNVVAIQAMQSVLEVEGRFLNTPRILPIVLAHLAFLYNVVGELWSDLDPAFRKIMQHEGQLAKQMYEDAISQYMRDHNCQQAFAIQFLQDTALERLEDRHRKITYVLHRLTEKTLSGFSGKNTFSHFEVHGISL